MKIKLAKVKFAVNLIEMQQRCKDINGNGIIWKN